jgi:PTH1 family peptidyl-tRNA hydrolase
MKLVVGLGNPGRRYEGTRHNVGFEVVDRLADQLAADRRWSGRFEGDTLDLVVGAQRVLFLKPLVYMNLSGRSVAAAVQFFQLSLDDVLVVCDDFQLPLGKLRFRSQGTPGGQNGLASVLEALGSTGISRLRLGIGPVPPEWSSTDFVLGRFTSAEKPLAVEMIGRAAQGVTDWISEGIAAVMNRFNRGDEPEPRGKS